MVNHAVRKIRTGQLASGAHALSIYDFDATVRLFKGQDALDLNFNELSSIVDARVPNHLNHMIPFVTKIIQISDPITFLAEQMCQHISGME
jgi:hypothetical protein